MLFMTMMRASLFQLITTLVLSAQLFNFSIDPAECPGYENPNVNEIESFLELLLENVLNLGDAIQETDEGDDNSGQREGAFKYYFANFSIAVHTRIEVRPCAYNLYQPAQFQSPVATILTPPPRSLMI